MQFHFSDHLLDTDRRELRRGEDKIALEPQVFDLLVYLVENRDRVVRKDDLIANVWWPDRLRINVDEQNQRRSQRRRR